MDFTFKQKAEIFLFGVVFLAHLFIVFGAIKQMKSPAFSRGLQQSSEIMTRNVR